MVGLACRHIQKYPSYCSVSGQTWKCLSDCTAGSVCSCTALLFGVPQVLPRFTSPSLNHLLNALSYPLLTSIHPLSVWNCMGIFTLRSFIRVAVCSPCSPLLPSPYISSLSPAVLTVNILQPVPSCSLLCFLYSKQTESCLLFSASSSANNPIRIIRREKQLIGPHWSSEGWWLLENRVHQHMEGSDRV